MARDCKLLQDKKNETEKKKTLILIFKVHKTWILCNLLHFCSSTIFSRVNLHQKLCEPHPHTHTRKSICNWITWHWTRKFLGRRNKNQASRTAESVVQTIYLLCGRVLVVSKVIMPLFNNRTCENSSSTTHSYSKNAEIRRCVCCAMHCCLLVITRMMLKYCLVLSDLSSLLHRILNRIYTSCPLY